MKLFATLMLAFAALTPAAHAGDLTAELRCEVLFRTVEPWRTEAIAETNAYLKKLPNRDRLEAQLMKAYDVRKVEQRHKMKTRQGELQFVRNGVGKPTELIYVDRSTEPETTRVIYSTHGERRNGSVYAFEMSVSPDEKHVMVLEGRDGQTDNLTARIFELETFKSVTSLGSLTPDRFNWISNDTFAYWWRDGSNYQKFTIKHDRLKRLKGLTSTEVSQDQRYVFAKGTRGRFIRKMADGEWLAIARDVDRFVRGETPTGEFLTVTDATSATTHDEIWGHTFADGKLKSRLIYRATLGYLRQTATGFGKIAVYENSMNGMALRILDLSGQTLFASSMPTSSMITKIEFTSETTLALTMTSPIIATKKFVFDIETGKYEGEDPRTAMMRDQEGRTFKSEIVKFTSTDGTELPMRIVTREGFVRNGEAPALMGVYGGFKLTPYFFPSFNEIRKIALNNGAVLASPVVRGGGEFGEASHEPALRSGKPRSFEDVESAADYLVREGYSKSDRMALSGWSGGALVVASVINRRPDLFAAAVVGSGVLDMDMKQVWDVNFGAGWSNEYGRSDDPFVRGVMMRYSPIQNLKGDVPYPLTIVVQGRGDTRVNPLHSDAYVQAARAQTARVNPVLFLSYKNAGHHPLMVNYHGFIALHAETAVWSAVFDKIGLELAPAAEAPPMTSEAQPIGSEAK